MGFVKGMDVSMAKALEAHGASYYLDGKQDDLFRILKKCGTDMIRLRIWPDPYDASGAPYGGGNNDLQTTVELAQRAKSSGMEVLLDFQYSDFWADPAKQIKPKAWKSLTGKELEAAVYLHTRVLKQELCCIWISEQTPSCMNGGLTLLSRLTLTMTSSVCLTIHTGTEDSTFFLTI